MRAAGVPAGVNVLGVALLAGGAYMLVLRIGFPDAWRDAMAVVRRLSAGQADPRPAARAARAGRAGRTAVGRAAAVGGGRGLMAITATGATRAPETQGNAMRARSTDGEEGTCASS